MQRFTSRDCGEEERVTVDLQERLACSSYTHDLLLEYRGHVCVWTPRTWSRRSLADSPVSLQRIAGITAMLQQSLEGLLLEGLQTADVDIVRHCLRTYATIDKTRDAEALVGQVLVKPYMDQVCDLKGSIPSTSKSIYSVSKTSLGARPDQRALCRGACLLQYRV